MTFTDNATNSPQMVSLAGVGTIASLSPTAINFGSVGVGKTSQAKVITLTNVGTSSLSITSITVAGNFLISAKTCGNTLGAGASCTVSVKFHPLAKGIRKGNVSFVDNGGGSPQSVSLMGTGT